MESTLCVDDELKEDEYDALNDETFGGAEADDAWEDDHDVLAAQLEETIKREHNAQHIEDIVNTTILQLGLDDEATTNGHSAGAPASLGSGGGGRSDPLGRTVPHSLANACRPAGFNGFFHRPATNTALASPLPAFSSQLPTGQGPIVLPRPPAVSHGSAGFPPMMAVSAGQLEQQMLQASRVPQSAPRPRMKTMEELEKQMVEESRRALMTRAQQHQLQQQQQQQHGPLPSPQPPGMGQDQQRTAIRPPFGMMRPQLPQQQHPPPSFAAGPPHGLASPHPLGQPHGPSPGSLPMGHHPQQGGPNHMGLSDMDHKRSMGHHQMPARQPGPHMEPHRQFRPHHDQFGYHEGPGSRPPPWEMNHNMHHNNWPSQPVYPPPSHFQRPPFNQGPPNKFMGFREPYRGNGRRSHEEGRLPEWFGAPPNNQRRYNSRDVETFGFDAVHEYQQEQNAASAKAIAGGGDRPDDPYAGLMTDKEKEFVIRAQMMSLNMQAPEEQDYYYIEYMKRRSQGKAVVRNQLLTQRYERTPDRPREPQQFENSLGKLHTVTAHAPKKILDMTGSRKLDDGDGRTVPANTDLLLFRKLLMDTEKMFSLLLKVEDAVKVKARDEVTEVARDLAWQIGPCPDAVLSLRKGRTLVVRSITAFWRLGILRERSLEILSYIIENLELILLKQKPLGDAVFVDKFDLIEFIISECEPEEIARLQKCMSKYKQPGDEVGEWILREKLGSLFQEALFERASAT